MRRDPWNYASAPLYLAVLGAAKTVERFRVRNRYQHPPRETSVTEPEERWCARCSEFVVWEPVNWVIEQVTDWECSECGDVIYGE